MERNWHPSYNNWLLHFASEDRERDLTSAKIQFRNVSQFRLTFIENSSPSVLFLKDADPNWSQGVRMCWHIQCKEHGSTHNTHMCALVLTLADMMHSDSLTTHANVSLQSKKSSHQCSYKDRWNSTHTVSSPPRTSSEERRGHHPTHDL